ncbi:MAG: right-handed parallel beta-helix repeat-containing protein [Acidobacteriia bacterium]|nr:right-handed parallel beta-helix repeat-containing protein [Terriglobia bacterium]
MHLTRLHLVLLSTLILHSASTAAVFYVRTGGSDLNTGADWLHAKATVQATINAASDGDEIWVAAGTYAEHLQNKVVGGLAVNVALYGGFAGTETSRDQRNLALNVTVLDGTNTGIVFTINSLAGPTTRVDGFTIRNGWATGITNAGGAFHVVGSAPTIANDLVTANTADSFGGAILIAGYKTTSPVAHAVITRNQIYFNRAGDGGAGISIIGSSPEISYNVISLNYTTGEGGGIGCWTTESAKVCSPTIADNYIYENGSNFSDIGQTLGGGGIYATSDGTDGRPIPFAVSAPLIVNNLIGANGAVASGGGIVVIDSEIQAATVVNNTVWGNNGSGIYWSQTFPTIANNVIAYNTWGLERENEGATRATVSHNDVYGNTVQGARSDFKGLGDPTGNNGNISNDPRLVDYSTGRFHLQPDSPCVNAGDNAAVPSGWPDIDGQARILGSSVDMGADESDGTFWDATVPVVHVRPDGNDSSDGLTWATAKATLLGATTTAHNIAGEVWVEQGSYAGHFRLPAWVHLYGGFNGTETSRDGRNPASYVSVIDGGGTPGVVSSSLAGHLLSAIDGFTIRNGGVFTGGNYIIQGGPGGRGGGVDCDVSSPMIANNVITRNSLGSPYTTDESQGAGIGLYGSYATITGNTLFDNEVLRSSGTGGAIYLVSSMPLIDGNDIHSNHAPYGSAIYAYNSDPRILRNTIANNSQYVLMPLYFGSTTGAVDIELCKDFLLERNTISGSTAFTGGGLVVQSTFQGRVADNVFRANTAYDYSSSSGGIGGGAYIQATASPTGPMSIVNNTFSDNSASNFFLGERGGGLAVAPLSASLTIANNVIAFNSSGIWRDSSASYTPTLETNDVFNGTGKEYINLSAGLTDLHADPGFLNRAGGDLHIGASSVCVDAGTNAEVAAGELDRDGALRIQDGNLDGVAIVDIGAYEFTTDSDGDGVPNATDCAAFDPTAWAVPAEIGGMVFAADKMTLSWNSLSSQAGPGVVYDVMRGSLGQFPVGTGGAETCLHDNLAANSWSDGTVPTSAQGFYYLVRGENVCAIGTYGTRSGGVNRTSTVCP